MNKLFILILSVSMLCVIPATMSVAPGTLNEMVSVGEKVKELAQYNSSAFKENGTLTGIGMAFRKPGFMLSCFGSIQPNSVVLPGVTVSQFENMSIYIC